MSLDQVIREAVLKLSVESKKAEKELKDFTKATDATAKSLDNVSVQSLDVQKAIDSIGLGAEKQVPRLTRLNSSFQGFTGKIGQGIGAIDNFAKAMAPWNQVVELGGKALAGVNAGLDAYAKTSPQAAKEVEALKNEFGHLKEAALAAAGAMTVEVAKAIPVADELKRKYIEIENTKFFKAFGLRSSGGALNGVSFRGDFLAGDDEASASTVDKDQFRTFINQTLPGYVDGLDKVRLKSIAVGEAQKKAAIDAARWRAELAALSSRNAKDVTDDLVKDLEAQYADGPSKITDKQLQMQMGINLDKVLSAPSDREEKGPSLLARLGIDDPSKIDAATTAIQGLAAGMQSAFQLIGEGSMSAGEAVKKGLGIAVRAIGDKLAAYAAAEAVEGAAMLLTLNPAGALHLGAAGLYGAGAIAAYAAASKLSGGSGGASPSVPGARGSRGATGGAATAGAGTGGGGRTTNYIIVGNDPANDDSYRMRQRKAEKYVAFAEGRTSAGFSG